MRRTWRWIIAVPCLFLACDKPLPSSPPLFAESGAGITRPGNVVDLAVASTTDTLATLTFTEVSNGDAGPASYDIRYARNSISWGSAPSVARGTCAVPVAGVAAGASRSCTVAGLAPGTSYQFQLVSFRGTLNRDAVFGALSNVASGTTRLTVASVSITPAAPADTIGKTIQFKASALDGSGNIVPGQTITWRSGDSSIVRIDDSGLARLVAAGSATVTAAAAGKAGTAQVRVLAARPGTVSDLVVVSTNDSSLTLQFTEVGGGTGLPADYDIRVAQTTMSWGAAQSVSRGSCATPLKGSAIGAARRCTITGLDPATIYAVQLVAFRGTLNLNAVFGSLSNAVAAATTASAPSPGPVAAECSAPKPAWIWCDDFEQDRLSRYFEYDAAGGKFVRADAVGVAGSMGMQAHWNTGTVGAGALHLAIGRTPLAYFRPVDAGTANYREIYWRLYVRNQEGWTGGGGDKLTRAFVFANANWAQAAIGHVWSEEGPTGYNLVVDPASGTSSEGTLVTTGYNDFAHLSWLGKASSQTPIFDAAHVGPWHCVESHMKLNEAGQSDGVLEIWIDGALEARRSGLNFLGSFSQYGINAVYFENYWNTGSVIPQDRYMDNIVVSTERIGCL